MQHSPSMLPSTSSCLDEQTLLALVSGSLTPERLRGVEAHVAQCVDCQRLVAEASSSMDSTLATLEHAGSHERSRFERDQLAASDKRIPDHLPAVGAILGGRYRVDGWLGRGGMGSVMHGTHLGLGQRVAIKILHLVDPDAVARFMREGRTLAQLHSQHIVRVYDSGNLDDATPFIVMEYLEGYDLAQLLKSGPLEVDVAVSYVRQACRALETAHAAGIIHRDLKPSNLYLAKLSDGNSLIKVLDFGISKNTKGEELAATLTTTNTMIGSPRYMSPEQLSASHRVDRAADIWSLGVILYELLVGHAPFEQVNITSLLLAITSKAPAPLRQQRPSLPPGLEAIVLRCLEKEPSRRFASAAELSAALAPFEARVQASPASANDRKQRLPYIVLGLALLVLCGWGLVRYFEKPALHADSPLQPSAAPSAPDAVPTETSQSASVQAGAPPTSLAPSSPQPVAGMAAPAVAAAANDREVESPQPAKPASKAPSVAPPRAAVQVAPKASAGRSERRVSPPAKPLGPLDTPD